MFTLDGMRKFHSWTHESLDVLFDHLGILTAAEYEQQIAGFGFPSVHAQVVHILGCEVRWVTRLRALAVGAWDPGSWPTIAEARTLQAEARAQTLEYLAGLSEEQLNANAELRFPDGVFFRTPALVLHHVFTHAFHHKGQIVAMCRILGHPAPDTDLNQFE